MQEDEEKRGEGKARQLWGWLVKRVAEKRRESLHVNVTTEHNDQDQDDHAKYWLQEQFEGMTYEEIAIWVNTFDFYVTLLFLSLCFIGRWTPRPESPSHCSSSYSTASTGCS